MSQYAELFKFTQLRPVNGIDYYQVQKKHFLLYDDNKPTKLLAKIKEEGLPQGVKYALEHIDSDIFKNRLSSYENIATLINNKHSGLYTLVSIMQKVIEHLKAYPLQDGVYNDLEILQYSRSLFKKYSLDRQLTLKEMRGIEIDTIRDDLYSLLLCSVYYVEYRRYLDILFKMNILGIEKILTIFNSNNNSLSEEDYNVMNLFLTGRILLPNSVPVNKKPLPKIDDINSDNSNSQAPKPPMVIKGIGLSIIHQAVKANTKIQNEPKVVKKKVKKKKDIKASPSKISKKREVKK